MIDFAMRRLTPLRYPGGKASLTPLVADLVSRNGLTEGIYVEPFAGGAGVAIGLLLNEFVDQVVINDIDPAVCAFWRCVTERNRDFCERVVEVPLTIEEWEQQREILRSADADEFDRGFAMFYLNRTNRSGIMNGGVIGGKQQLGEWKINARFNREELAARVRRIGRYRSRIQVRNEDALLFLGRIESEIPPRALIYLDPPYYEKGQHLYTNFYRHDDHVAIAAAVKKLSRPWIVSYDDHSAIRAMYRGFRHRTYSLSYAARERRSGSEIMFFSPDLIVGPAG